MGQFDHIKQQTATTETVRFEIPELSGTPWLEVAQATEANPGFLNAALRMRNAQRRGVRQGRVSPGQIERGRQTDLVLFSKHVVKGWGNVTDNSMKPVEFTPEDCREFLEALPLDISNELRAFCTDPANFREGADADYGETAKN